MNEALWRRVEAALDDRRDPFADRQLAADLVADPRAEAEARRLTIHLALLQELPRRRRQPTRRHLAVLAAAMLVLVMALQISRSLLRVEGSQAAQIDASSTVSLVVEHHSPPPARRARVVLEPRRVLGWTLEGEAP